VANLEAASGGRLDIDLHAGGEVAPIMQELDGIDTGLIDIASTCTMYWMDRFGPATNLFTYQIAGLSPTEQQMWMQFEGLDLLSEMAADYNVYFNKAGHYTVPEMFISTKTPLNGPEDVQGLKLRTAGDDGVIFNEMGASVVTLGTNETYEALQRGVIDGYQLSSPGFDYSVAMYEVVDYFYLGSVRQPCEWQPQMINMDSWNELPDDLKKMVEEMGKAAGFNYYYFMTQKDLEVLPLYEEQGATVSFIPQSIADEFVERANVLYSERAAEDPFFDKVYTSIQNFKDAYRTAWQRM
jgi:TRAP-type mannitol/chloroaromatic compound transport system substrate-binding protein